MTKTLQKAMIKRFNKARSDENWSLYKTQSNFCTKLLKKT